MSSDSDRTAPPVEILLVEDNLGDARLTREALKEGKVYNNLHWVKDGVEALDFLYMRGKYKDAPKPDIILLDLNLPKKDGRECCRRSRPTRGSCGSRWWCSPPRRRRRTCSRPTRCTRTAT